MNKNTAFSLIEISIIAIIIGILIAGISSGIDLYQDFKLSNAKTLTINSRVQRINGLVAWFEPVLENNFLSDEAKDNMQISIWKDARIITNLKFNLVKNKSASVIYKKNGINNLPSIYFNGTSGALFLSPTTSESQSTYLDSFNQQISIFLIYHVIENNINGIIFNNGNTAISGFTYFVPNGDFLKRKILFGGIDVYGNSNNYKNNIGEMASIIYNCRGQQFEIYINGESFPIAVGSPNINNSTSKLTIGANTGNGEQLKGFISEIIIYDRPLKKSERQDIEKYLSKKYAIKINQS